MSGKIGRLAMRVEGDNWNAYYAMPDTMEGAVYLGSIAMAFVKPPHEDRKNAFLYFMRECVADIIEAQVGERPKWNDPSPAPESERSGNA